MATSLILESMELMLSCLVRKLKTMSKQSRKVNAGGGAGDKLEVKNDRD